MQFRANSLTFRGSRAVFLLCWAAFALWFFGKFKLEYAAGSAAAVVAGALAWWKGWRLMAAALPVAVTGARAAIFVVRPAPGAPDAAMLWISIVAVPIFVYFNEIAACDAGAVWLRPRAAKLAAKLAVAAVALDLALYGAEKLIIQFSPRDVYEIVASEGSAAKELYINDPLLVRRQAAKFRGRFVHPEYRRELYTTNSDGFRDAEWPREWPADETRILCLGDSMTAGLGLNDEETIPARAQAALAGAERGGKVRFLNAGVSSYGPRQYEFLLKQQFERVKPAIVIICFYDGNDLEDCRVQFRVSRENGLNQVLLPSEREAGAEGAEDSEAASLSARAGMPSLLTREYWTANSVLYRLADGAVAPALVRAGLADPLAVFNYPMLLAMKKTRSAATSENYQLARDAILNIANYCKERGARAMLARMPARVQAESELWDSTMARLRLRAENFDRIMPGAEILQFARSAGMDTLDLLPILESPAGSGAKASAYYYNEGHFNRAGAALVSNEIVKWLRESGALKGR